MARIRPGTYAPEHPEVPDGEVTGPPDLVGVGAQRAGTTWWWRGAIRSHPGFAREVEAGQGAPLLRPLLGRARDPRRPRRAVRAAASRGRGRDHRRVDPALHARLLGAAAAARAAPEARILVMLRDPVERYRSGVARELRSPTRTAPAGDRDRRRRASTAACTRSSSSACSSCSSASGCWSSSTSAAAPTRWRDAAHPGFLGLEPLTEMPERPRPPGRPARRS